MIRVSTTTLEQYRRCMETEYANPLELIAQIKGEAFAPSWQMEAGTAWDLALQGVGKPVHIDEMHDQNTGETEPVFMTEVRRHRFRDNDIAKAKEHIGPGLWQVKTTRVLDSVFGPVTMVGVADHMRGSIIQETKAKFTQADPKDYETSLQWRLYLMLFGASVVRYNLFSFRDPKGGYCELTDITSFRMWPYAELEKDCHEWLNEFLAWANDRNLLPFLNREGTSTAAA